MRIYIYIIYINMEYLYRNKINMNMSAIYDINMCARTPRASKDRLDQLSMHGALAALNETTEKCA